MARSLAGMMREERTTASPGSTRTRLWSSIAMRTSAESASAWLPAVMRVSSPPGRPRALGAQLGEPPDVRQPPVERRLVELEVAGVDDGPDRGVDREPDRVRDRVRHREGLDRERPDPARLRAVGRERDREAVLAQPL